MSEQRENAADLEQRYVDEHAETEQVLEGLDPADPDRGAVEQVEAVGDEQHFAADDHVETMSGDDS